MTLLDTDGQCDAVPLRVGLCELEYVAEEQRETVGQALALGQCETVDVIVELRHSVGEVLAEPLAEGEAQAVAGSDAEYVPLSEPLFVAVAHEEMETELHGEDEPLPEGEAEAEGQRETDIVTVPL